MIPSELLLEGAQALFVDSTLKVALVNNPGAAYGRDVIYDDIDTHIIADGYAGTLWADLNYLVGDLYFDGFGVVLPNKNIVFSRDNTATPLNITGAVILRENGVADYSIVDTISFESTVSVASGQGVVVVIQCGYDG